MLVHRIAFVMKSRGFAGQLGLEIDASRSLSDIGWSGGNSVALQAIEYVVIHVERRSWIVITKMLAIDPQAAKSVAAQDEHRLNPVNFRLLWVCARLLLDK